MNRNGLQLLVSCCVSLCLLVLILLSFKAETADGEFQNSAILIEKVYPDGLSANDRDEAVGLINIGAEPFNIGGWHLSDSTENLTKLKLPSDLILQPQERVWIAREAAPFKLHFGFPPRVEQGDTVENILKAEGSWPGFANSGDEVLLSNGSGVLVDALVFENGNGDELENFGEWSGAPLEFYGLGAAEGQILFRKRSTITGMPLEDTNSAADWGQDPADFVFGRRVEYPGWETERFSQTFNIQESAFLTIAIAPDNAFETISTLLDSAKQSIVIETHTFENHEILERLIAAENRGVEVKILMEGAPPGGVQDAQRYNCFKLTQAGGECYIMQNDSSARIFDRYRFLHAKFMVIDAKWAVIGSDNLSPNSWPADRKDDGTHGRRGVIVVTDSKGVVSHLQSIFADDLDQLAHHDITSWLPVNSSLGFPLDSYEPSETENWLTYTVNFTQPASFYGIFDFELIQSPENFVNPNSGLFGLLKQAKRGDTVLVEQQYERLYWGASGNPITDPNLRLAEYLAAARRGSQVKVLLDRYFDDGRNPAGNWATCLWLNNLARVESLDLKCQLGNPTGLGIHNKMVLAEIGGQGYVHIGSINGSEQSAKGNREVALQVQSDEAYAYLAKMYRSDFIERIYMPWIGQNVPTDADYPVISEVLYNPFGSTEGAEFIELFNPTGRSIDLSNYSLSDAEFAEDFADLRRFPIDSVLEPGEVIVIAQQAAEFEETFGTLPNYEILDTDPSVPNLADDLSWGDEATFLRLGNGGDVVFFRDAADRPVDVLVYGERQVAGYETCLGTDISGASLRRNPAGIDTNSCQDFDILINPNPGQVP